MLGGCVCVVVAALEALPYSSVVAALQRQLFPDGGAAPPTAVEVAGPTASELDVLCCALAAFDSVVSVKVLRKHWQGWVILSSLRSAAVAASCTALLRAGRHLRAVECVVVCCTAGPASPARACCLRVLGRAACVRVAVVPPTVDRSVCAGSLT